MENISMQAAITGICATTLMTIFIYLVSLVLNKRLQVIQILGTMLTNKTTIDRGLSTKAGTWLTGVVTHYLVGIAFALAYIYLAQSGIANYHISNTLTFGFLIGLFAAGIWWLFFFLHPNPPLINLYYYLPCIFLSHLVFGTGLTWSYILFLV